MSVIESLKQLSLKPGQISTTAEDLKSFGKDWSMYFEANASAILFPESEEDVIKITQWANTHKVALVPSGGRTGLSSAATATNGEVVVAFDRMNKILSFNEIEQTLCVQPGVITETIQNYAKEKGLYYPIDFAAKGSSQIGGNVATNAGGVKVVRYGLTRDWITGLKVVTGAGQSLYLNKSLKKNATGYDLRHLFIGSEGTLGLITEVELRLAPAPLPSKVLVLALTQLEKVLNIYNKFNKVLTLNACEFFSQQALEKVLANMESLEKPFESDYPYYLLLEVEENHPQFIEVLEDSFSYCFEQGWIVDGVISQNSQQAQNFWNLREFISESISHYKPYKNDVSVRLSAVPDFIKQTQAFITRSYPDFEVIWFGHIGDGNVHINILKPENLSKEEFIKKCQKVDDTLYPLIEKFKGSISAEHGVGLIKKNYLGFSRSKNEIDLMRGIKKVFDPNNIMNPGKIF